ncbi:hypothetical protein AX774_g5027 [Zancudomyces culisetae]|uniref:Uncharacterized protein n=1 Tax=Zancudomyces culisetae TaxID=1213189 RepID=A0A1R1PKL0_ZANCU|nr:hypothetical protein AX774_g5027 [Zancudomyces culisetae]|eukprot:OMH81511.1 hypothetical protein AX774_g5027 [Zancudomyces culisetae]
MKIISENTKIDKPINLLNVAPSKLAAEALMSVTSDIELVSCVTGTDTVLVCVDTSVAVFTTVVVGTPTPITACSVVVAPTLEITAAVSVITASVVKVVSPTSFVLLGKVSEVCVENETTVVPISLLLTTFWRGTKNLMPRSWLFC